MTARTYYLPIRRKGHVDTSLVSTRKIAMDYMRSHNQDSLTVYTSATRKIEVGTIIHAPSCRSVYVWCYQSAGRELEAPILADGTIRRDL